MAWRRCAPKGRFFYAGSRYETKGRGAEPHGLGTDPSNQELRDAIENSDDPDTLERVAREKGYVKQGETLYIDVAG